VLVLCLSACLPAQALAAAAAPARKSPARKTPKSPAVKAPAAREDFQSVFSAAVRFYENFEYEQSLEQLSRAKALAQGLEQEVLVALYQGVVRAELGQREESLAAFRTGLYLKPDAKLPVKVSPKVERDFEDVRQAVQADLGLPTTSTPATGAPPPADRPVQPPALTASVDPPHQAPAYVPSASTAQQPGPRVLPLVFLGAGAVAGGAASFFGLQSASSVQSALRADFYDQRTERLKTAEDQAFIANLLFGTASAAALGALATFLIPGSPSAPASASTGGGSP
jgi:tetratricopeptide (TPR) repeat protein